MKKLILAILLLFLLISPCFADDQQDVELSSKFKTIILNKWQSTQTNDWIVVKYSVEKDSFLNYVKILGSSDNSEFNKSVTDCINNSNSLFFLPENSKQSDENFIYLIFNTKDENKRGIIDITSWIKDINEKINLNIEKSANKVESPAYAKIDFIISSTGDIVSARIIDSSDNEMYNNILAKSIKTLSSIPKLPSDYPFVYLEFELSFDANSKNIDYSDYIQSIRDEIKSNWNVKKDGTFNYANVLFRVDRNGHVLSKKLITSTDDPAFNEQSFAAIDKIQKVSPFPSGCSRDFVDISFSFEKNITAKKRAALVKRGIIKVEKNPFTKTQQKELNKYAKKQQKIVQNNINYKSKFFSYPKCIILSFDINNDGKYSGNLNILSPSTDNKFDKAAIDSLKNSRYEKFPNFVKSKKITLTQIYWTSGDFLNTITCLNLVNLILLISL